MGLHDRELQKSLLMSETLTLDAIEKKMLSSEVANRQTKAMNSEPRRDEVHSVKSRLGKKVGKSSRNYWRDRSDREYRAELLIGMKSEQVSVVDLRLSPKIAMHTLMQFVIIAKSEDI